MTLYTVAFYVLLMFVPSYIIVSLITIKYVVYTPDMVHSYYNGIKTYTIHSYHSLLVCAKLKAQVLEEGGTPAIVGKAPKGF